MEKFKCVRCSRLMVLVAVGEMKGLRCPNGHRISLEHAELVLEQRETGVVAPVGWFPRFE